MPEFQGNIPAGNADKGGNPLQRRRRRSDSNEHFFPSRWEQGKSIDNKLDW
jgi:hypothetical protein